MANLINLGCDPSMVRNFATGNCSAEYGAWQYALLVPKNWSLTPTEYNTNLLASLLADNTANAYDQRIYLIGNFHTVELAYQDQNVVTRQDGSSRKTRDAVAGWRLIMDKGGICTSIALQSVDELQDTFNIVFLSSKNALVGTQLVVPGATVGDPALIHFTGLEMSMMSTETPQIGQYEEVDRYPFNVQLADRSQLFDNPMLLGADIDDLITNLPNITDVMLAQIDAITGMGVVNVAMAAGCGATNLATGLTAATWANVARFAIKNYQTGATITLTSVAVNASQSGFVFDIDSTDTDYPTSGQYLSIEFVAVQTLAAAGLEYFASYARNANGISGTKLLIQIP